MSERRTFYEALEEDRAKLKAELRRFFTLRRLSWILIGYSVWMIPVALLVETPPVSYALAAFGALCIAAGVHILRIVRRVESPPEEQP